MSTFAHILVASLAIAVIGLVAADIADLRQRIRKQRERSRKP